MFRPQETPLRLTAFQAHVARPVKIDSQFTHFEGTVNNQDMLSEEVSVTCGESITFRMTLPPKPVNQLVVRSLWVVPRRVDDSPDGFRYVDFSSDLWLSLEFDQQFDREARQVVSDTVDVIWRPGKYRVRYYLQDRQIDRETEPLPETFYIGEGGLEVLESPSGIICDCVPARRTDNLVEAVSDDDHVD